MESNDDERAAGRKKAAPAAWAHLAGYALIAAAIFFGLRSRTAPAPPATPAPTSPPLPAVVAVEGASTRPAVPGEPPSRIEPPGSADARAKLQPEAKSALEKQRAEMVSSCWEPIAGKGASGKLTFRFLIGADGKEHHRSIRREAGPDDVRLIECLTDPKRGRIEVSPPGTQVGVVVEMTLP